MEKLHVKRFLGLRDVRLEVLPITILIGQQASGKSVLAKVLFHCRSLPEILLEQAFEGVSRKSFEKAFLTRFCEYFPATSWSKDKFEIAYETHNLFVRITKTSSSLNASTELLLEYSPWLAEEFHRVQKKYEAGKKPGIRPAQLEQYRLREQVTADLFKVLKRRCDSLPTSQLFIPAGRAFFAILQNNIFSFLSSANAIDPFLGHFGQYFEMMKHLSSESFMEVNKQAFKDFQGVERYCRDVVCGEYIVEKGKDYLKTIDGRKITLANASSGQQESLPLSLMLKLQAINFPMRFPFGADIGNRSAIYIEEPEAHLFPLSQKAVVELIATIYNMRERRTGYFLTTHSPYVLSSFNNLLLGGQLALSRSSRVRAGARKVVPKDRALAKLSVKAYAIENGRSIDIMDEDSGLIDNNIIDGVSNSIGREFEQLLSLGV